MSDTSALREAQESTFPFLLPLPKSRPPVALPFILPFTVYSPKPMEVFSPESHLPHPAQQHGGLSGADAPLPLTTAAKAHSTIALIPRVEDCYALWDKYEMFDNIRQHSAKVADLAFAIAVLARERGMDVNPEAVLAAGLLHDIGKTYAILHGGHHAQLGAAWTMRETRNGPIAQAVLFHVNWPWMEDVDDDRLFTVFSILYSDKRVRHDVYVGLEERFVDLIERYGVTEYAKERIALSHAQGQRIETALSRRLGVDLNEYIADSGRLVKRA